jgi:hypothetical protein
LEVWAILWYTVVEICSQKYPEETFMKRSSLFYGLVLLGSFTLIHPAQAVTITEHTLELNAKPGDVIERSLNLYDDKLKGVTVYASVSNFKPDPASEGSALLVTEPGELKPDRDWVKFDTNTVELPKSGDMIPFNYRIELPTNADPGTHLISLVFSTKPPSADTNSSVVSIGTNLLANIFLRVSGATIDSIDATFKVGTFTNNDPALKPAEREKFFEEKKLFFKPPVDFMLRVENKGNTHQKPDGNIKIQNDIFGRAYDVIPVNADNLIITPGTSRAFVVDSFGKGLMIGKYRAKLTLVYGAPLRDIVKEVDFWIIPVKEIAIALGALLLLIIIIIILRKFGKRREARKEKVIEADIRRTLREEIKQSIREAQQPDKSAETKSSSEPKSEAEPKQPDKPSVPPPVV